MTVGEDVVSLYLRLKGFFQIRNFVVHRTEQKPLEIDLIGIRPPYSEEKIDEITFNDKLHDFGQPFQDHEMLLLLGEVTDSKKSNAIKERLDRLKDDERIRYVLNRFGVGGLDDGLYSQLKKGEPINHPRIIGLKVRLLRILFIPEEARHRAENSGGIRFIQIENALRFIEQRIKENRYLKEKSSYLLPAILELIIRYAST